jgi:hypothetical protein
MPLEGSHVGVDGSHFDVPGWQAPLMHIAVLGMLHRSLQVMPSFAGCGVEQVPVDGSHVTDWHCGAVHFGVPPPHTPFVQVWPCVHRSGLQELPSAALEGLGQPMVGSQMPATWHVPPVGQLTIVPVHVPF